MTVTATVSSTDSPLVPGGHVQFFDGPTSIGIAELDPSGTQLDEAVAGGRHL
ncbi:MAG: hypothetical protein R2690_00165 [Acidimicrobiales bacterium]